LPSNPDDIFYGIDFGFNNQTAVILVAVKDMAYYWHELLYEKHLTNQMLIMELNNLRKKGLITSKMKGYADSAEPNRIQEINDGMTTDSGEKIMGFNVEAADKSVKDGIDYVRSRPLYITKSSVNVHQEIRNYMFKTKNGIILTDDPVKINDHAMDSGRYAQYSHHINNKPSSNIIRIIG
jgi:phage terminase large subunit